MQMDAEWPQAREYEVIDLDTGQPIPRVVFADDETGEYQQFEWTIARAGEEPEPPTVHHRHGRIAIRPLASRASAP